MKHARDLQPGQAEYPSRIRELDRPPTTLSIAGAIDEHARTVAIVGRRDARPEAVSFASALAEACVHAGAVIVSGGATGIDAAAHRGALAAGGRTWAVVPTGRERLFPPEHLELYPAIVAAGGAMVWPFEPTSPALPWNFFRRNRILVALSDVVVVVQADIPSGALNAARWARELARPLWVVPASPWVEGFRGCSVLLDQGARPLTSIAHFLQQTGLVPRSSGRLGVRKAAAAQLALPPSSVKVALREYSEAEKAVLGVASAEPVHLDELVVLTSLSAGAAMTALLTLSLEHVLVEGPDGFFRRS